MVKDLIMLFFGNARYELLSLIFFPISEVGMGSSCAKMSTGAGKRTSEKALSKDGLSAPKVEGVHFHEQLLQSSHLVPDMLVT